MNHFKYLFILFAALYFQPLNSQGQESIESLQKKIGKIPDQDMLSDILALPFDKYAANLIEAERLFNDALVLAKKYENHSRIGDLYSRLAVINYLRGNYDKSVDFNQKAIELFLESKQLVKAGFTYCEMGYQMKRRNINLAFDYMRKGMTLLKKSDSIINMSAPYDNYGVLHEMSDHFDSALYYYNKALAIKVQLSDSLGIPFSLNNIAQTYMLQNKYELAREYLDKAYAIRLKRDDVFGIIENLSLYGDLYTAQGNWNEAIKHFLAGLEKTKAAGYIYLWQYICEKLSVCFENTGNLREALKYQREYQLLKDSLINLETNNKIAQLEVGFRTIEKEKELETKAKELALLNQEKARQELLISNRNKIIIGISGLSATVTLVFLLFIQRYKQKQKLRLKSALLLEKELAINAVINAEEEERKRIARELHDGIGQQMTGLKMAWQVFNQNFLKDQKAVIAESERLLKILDNSAAEVRSISHQMMPRALKEAGLPGAISDLLAVYFGNSNIQYELNVSGMDEKLNKNIEITVFRVCQELINNIVKHSGASHIDLQLYRSRENLILSVTDNGAGFNVNDKKEGIGLMNIKSRVENVNGIFFIESELSKGSRATIRIPLPVV